MSENTQEVHGFYYDSQLNEPSLTISVHPNVEWTGKPEDNYFRLCTGGCLEPLSPKQDNSCHYSKDPIFRGFMTEDFQMAINNDWGKHDGGNAIENVFNQMKPMVGIISDKLEQIGKIAEKYKDSKNPIESWAGTINEGAKSLGEYTKLAKHFANGSLNFQGFRYSMFNRSSVNFNNLSVRGTLYTQYLENKKMFLSCVDQVSELFKYAKAINIPIKDSEFGKEASQLKAEAAKTLTEFGNSIIYWQQAPAGYEMRNRELGAVMKGTFRLIFANTYTIENLVIRNISVTYSKTMTKNPFQKNGKFKSVPLYADVVIEFQAVTEWTDQDLSNFVACNGMDKLYKEEKDYHESLLSGAPFGEVSAEESPKGLERGDYTEEKLRSQRGYEMIMKYNSSPPHPSPTVDSSAQKKSEILAEFKKNPPKRTDKYL